MLDKIHNDGANSVEQNQSLDRIRGYGVTNPFLEDDNNFFIDESRISNEALQKYQREIDIKDFSKMLTNLEQKDSDALVIQQAFDGQLSIDNDEILSNLLNSKEFLNDLM